MFLKFILSLSYSFSLLTIVCHDAIISIVYLLFASSIYQFFSVNCNFPGFSHFLKKQHSIIRNEAHENRDIVNAWLSSIVITFEFFVNFHLTELHLSI